MSELYVLVGRETYSAGMITAVELKHGSFAAMPDSESRAFAWRPTRRVRPEDRPLELPNSHLVMVFVSTRYYAALVQDNTPGSDPRQGNCFDLARSSPREETLYLNGSAHGDPPHRIIRKEVLYWSATRGCKGPTQKDAPSRCGALISPIA